MILIVAQFNGLIECLFEDQVRINDHVLVHFADVLNLRVLYVELLVYDLVKFVVPDVGINFKDSITLLNLKVVRHAYGAKSSIKVYWVASH